MEIMHIGVSAYLCRIGLLRVPGQCIVDRRTVTSVYYNVLVTFLFAIIRMVCL